MVDDQRIIEERKEKAVTWLRTHYNWISYLVLAVIVWLAVFIRTRNLAGLKDITTGGWTLGPDLDPFLFLRWAKYIVTNGSIMTVDYMRNVPLGTPTNGELLGTPYFIVFFHKIASAIGISHSIDQSAVLYPVFMFALTVIAFYFLVREIFVEEFGKTKSSIIALVSCFFLSTIPSLLPRTIAGIPEKEAGAFLFMFLAFYLFLLAWKAKTTHFRYILAVLAGLATAAMSLIWGGSTFIYITIGISVLIAFLLGQVNRQKLYIYITWLLVAYIVPAPFSTRYAPLNVLTSTISGIIIGIAIIIAFHLFFSRTKLFGYIERNKYVSKIPKPLISLLIVAIVVIIAGIAIFGFGFIGQKVSDITTNLITPINTRFGVTVAENRQPFFGEWSSSFGPAVRGIPIFFWLFVIGSVFLYNLMMKKVFTRKESIILTISYVVFLLALIFSRYSQNSVLNGTNTASILLYFVGFLALIGTFGYYYFKYYQTDNKDKFKLIPLALILVFSLFFLSLVSARGAVRLVMILVPSASILASYFIVSLTHTVMKKKESSSKMVYWVILAIVLIASIYAAFYFYQASVGTAQAFIPNAYTQQWQKAMAWVRDNTPTTAVFGHWWDYGYWVQSIGNRATVLDGGNTIVYWNHLMGRYALTGSNEQEALEFLYSHNTTHFLIDSTDIGKYSAFSSIGSDDNYDRFSWIPTFALDPSQTRESKNSTVSFYTGGTAIDADVTYNLNGTQVFLPEQKAVIAGFYIERDNNGTILSQPKGVYYYKNVPYTIPLRYIFDNKNKTLVDYGNGIDAGIYLMPRLIVSSNGQAQIQTDGVALYLSNRTVKSQLARLYLYNENDQYFKLVHSEDDFLVRDLKSQNGISQTQDFVFYDSIRGPIRIWEIKYPAGLKVNPEYLRTTYPNVNYTKVR